MVHRIGLSPDEIANLLREISEKESNGARDDIEWIPHNSNVTGKFDTRNALRQRSGPTSFAKQDFVLTIRLWISNSLTDFGSPIPCRARGSLVVKLTDSIPVHHEFEPSTTEDTPCSSVVLTGKEKKKRKMYDKKEDRKKRRIPRGCEARVDCKPGTSGL
ncbi:hypothetical protein TNCV_129701 [Trichonephila clavipes]|nr:hypothetical protein TNCV_129701 [Trichonephila clavipes]